MSKDVFFQQQHLRKWMEVVVLTHKGGQRSDGNVSDLFVSGRAPLPCTAVITVHIGAMRSVKTPVRKLVLYGYNLCKLSNVFY